VRRLRLRPALTLSEPAQGMASVRLGFHYMLDPANRDVATLSLLKPAAQLVWSASEILNTL
jgi:hypothetical protein